MAFKMKGFSPFTKKTGNPDLEQGLGNDEDMREYLERKEKEKAGAAKTPPPREKEEFKEPEVEENPEEETKPKSSRWEERADVEEKTKDEEDDDLPFKMSVSFSSPFTKTKDDPVDKNWKENQSIMDDLKSLKEDLRDAKTPEEKRKIQMDIEQTQKIIDKGYEESSQLNPNNPDRD
tara:strand:- start:924 stop:1454 length:531 start_codon:yes stop_codon:yes gene_type:complete